MTLAEEIRALAKERGAIVLAHNYCRADVQDVADFTGDSLELARLAAKAEAETLVFCGVSFMAETAKILNPARRVLLPDPTAGCPMAAMITGAQLRDLKARHPNAKAVCYVNSTAEVKAECDICVTSGNAERVMKTFAPNEEILFVPDQHLGGHVAALLGRSYELWPGFCPIHAALTAAQVEAAKAAHPNAPVIVHPECAKDVRDKADFCLSTGGMCAWAKASDATDVLVGTETGILHRLRRENPGKCFHPIGNLVCADMKKITLESVRDALAKGQYEVRVDADVARRARRAIEAMLNV